MIGEFVPMENLYLKEMPVRTGSMMHAGYYDLLKQNINSIDPDRIHRVIYQNGLYGLPVDDMMYVWIGNDINPDIIAELELVEQKPAIHIVGKRQGSKVYVSDFYEKIVEIFGTVLFSGDSLSPEAVFAWKNMVKHGKLVMIYDSKNPTNRISITDPEELEDYISDHDLSGQRYRFVLSETRENIDFLDKLFETYCLYRLAVKND